MLLFGSDIFRFNFRFAYSYASVVQLKMAEELAATFALGQSLSGGSFSMRLRKTPDHLQNVMHLVYLRKRRILGEKWNRLIYGVMFMSLRPRICMMLPPSRPAKIPAENPLPLLDVIQRIDGELVATQMVESEEEEKQSENK